MVNNGIQDWILCISPEFVDLLLQLFVNILHVILWWFGVIKKGGYVHKKQYCIVILLTTISYNYQWSFSIQGQKTIAYRFLFCCHFCHPFIIINILNMKLLYEMLKMTATKNETKLWFLGVQIFGVKSVPAKFITLMKCHTEKRRVRRIIHTKQW